MAKVGLGDHGAEIGRSALLLGPTIMLVKKAGTVVAKEMILNLAIHDMWVAVNEIYHNSRYKCCHRHITFSRCVVLDFVDLYMNSLTYRQYSYSPNPFSEPLQYIREDSKCDRQAAKTCSTCHACCSRRSATTTTAGSCSRSCRASACCGASAVVVVVDGLAVGSLNGPDFPSCV